ncbi:putative nuclease HARBI1 [Eupeodes corollae]|uniref:putative nuclease HARBI1 n=2 Tax=Eupeodes corollae TaxID=290404 RepID=UPI002491AA41|nr:putative nuclease HARBI1 [Eupeodes corollae]
MAVVLLLNSNGEERDHVLRRRIMDASNPFELDDLKFVSNFRLNKRAFKYVLDELSIEIQGGTSLSIPPILMLASTLRFFAEGGYQFGVGKDATLKMSQSSVSKCIKIVLNKLEVKLGTKWINFKLNHEEKEEMRLHFFEKFGFPGVIGCVDGTHIAIKSPALELRHLFYNRKGFHSLNVMIICDHKMRIRFVDATHPGATHDALAWKVSAARSHLLQQYTGTELRNNWLLGDAGYPLEPWLMTPFRSPVPGSIESKYNIQLSKARNINERTIGLLKNRFRCCLKARQLHYSAEKAAQIVNVCAALHNICIFFKVQDCENIDVEDRNESLLMDFDADENENTHLNEAQNARDRIAALF